MTSASAVFSVFLVLGCLSAYYVFNYLRIRSSLSRTKNFNCDEMFIGDRNGIAFDFERGAVIYAGSLMGRVKRFSAEQLTEYDVQSGLRKVEGKREQRYIAAINTTEIRPAEILLHLYRRADLHSVRACLEKMRKQTSKQCQIDKSKNRTERIAKRLDTIIEAELAQHPTASKKTELKCLLVSVLRAIDDSGFQTFENEFKRLDLSTLSDRLRGHFANPKLEAAYKEEYLYKLCSRLLSKEAPNLTKLKERTKEKG